MKGKDNYYFSTSKSKSKKHSTKKSYFYCYKDSLNLASCLLTQVFYQPPCAPRGQTPFLPSCLSTQFIVDGPEENFISRLKSIYYVQKSHERFLNYFGRAYLELASKGIRLWLVFSCPPLIVFFTSFYSFCLFLMGLWF